MFGSTEQTVINTWLESARNGHNMAIDSQEIKERLKAEIKRVEEYSKNRITEINNLLNNPKYFKQINAHTQKNAHLLNPWDLKAVIVMVVIGRRGARQLGVYDS